MKKIVFALAMMLATLGAAQAQTVAPEPAGKPVRFLIGMGLSGGGDELASVDYTGGYTGRVRAGGFMYFTAGADYHFTPQFSLQGTVNYHFDSTTARNADVKFERFPIELIGYYQPFPAWRVGGGLRYTNSPKLSAPGFAPGMEIKYDNTTGAVIETEYFTSPRLGIKLRYVNETFKARGHKDVDGSHGGVSLNYYF